ncbi:hypothetical protein AGMMS49983_15190 [Clostridia bacterium]|nr:hypothetical protein AGMMS49983_15190 [Clostridia bacterium]
MHDHGHKHDHHDHDHGHHDHDHSHALYSEDGIAPAVVSMKQHLGSAEISPDDLLAVCRTAVRILVQIAKERDWLLGHLKLYMDAGDGQQAFISATDERNITETLSDTWGVPGKENTEYEVGFTAIAFGAHEDDLAATVRGIFSGLLPNNSV